MQMLAERLVKVGLVEEISDETVRRTLKRGDVKLWLKKRWCIPKDGHEDLQPAVQSVFHDVVRPSHLVLSVIPR
jgi:hypothetical protein